jgi:hypothetical protein
MRNTFNASNVLYIKVAVKKNLDAKFLAVTADNFESFAPKSALYYATLSAASLYADLIKQVLALQNASNTKLVKLTLSKQVEKLLDKNAELMA